MLKSDKTFETKEVTILTRRHFDNHVSYLPDGRVVHNYFMKEYFKVIGDSEYNAEYFHKYFAGFGFE